MSLLARRREFLAAYRKTGSIAAAAKNLNIAYRNTKTGTAEFQRSPF